MRKQFDLSHLEVCETLQGKRLASFQRRALAFVFDWAVVGAFGYLHNWLLLAVVLFAVVRFKFNVVNRPKKLIEQGAKELLNKSENLRVGPRQQAHIRKFFRAYAHVLLHILFWSIILSILVGILVAYKSVMYGGGTESSGETSWFVSLPLFEILQDYFGAFFSTAFGLIYFTAFTYKLQGQTPGKRLFGIRAVKLNGKRLTLWNSLERLSGYVSSASLFMMGFFQMLWDKNHQCTHDKISETVVVFDDDQLRVMLAKKNKKVREMAEQENEEIAETA
ncbi:hypothetical protein FUAX_36670 [Fulvitalea axinellae]|uniref:RDD domain-containing protein n=1 Tax=Fulvitalea axinellae TaxID=1182444 RepID=A0AAU9DFE1_9BACT|nr:hypothetical protein FUAX_36670 [Fulvitalea axinellae]